MVQGDRKPGGGLPSRAAHGGGAREPFAEVRHPCARDAAIPPDADDAAERPHESGAHYRENGRDDARCARGPAGQPHERRGAKVAGRHLTREAPMKFLNGFKTIIGTFGLVIVTIAHEAPQLIPEKFQAALAGASAVLVALGLVHKLEKTNDAQKKV